LFIALMLLFIDPTDIDKNTLALVTPKKVTMFNFPGERTSENLMPQVKKFLAKNNYDFSDIEKIALVAGPGSFSKVRSGVAVANALGLALNLEIIALNKNKIPGDLQTLLREKGKKLIRPIYGGKPHITKPKKR
jgi:tRNA A37 threonylcarbamoyladenosine modification protein TsaB